MCGGTFWLRGNFLWTVEGRLGWGRGVRRYICVGGMGSHLWVDGNG